MRPSYERQLGMFDPTQYDADSAHITIAGLGNIGSHTALALARMGLRHFALYDFDTVEAHNLASQAYSVRDVGKLKVDAISTQMRALNPAIEIEKRAERYGGIGGTSILISAVDNLEARREMAAHSGAGTFVIDGRMGGGQIEVHSQYAPDWAATIPAAADDDPCGARFISYTSYLIAGLIANNVKRHLRGERVAKRILLHADTLQSEIAYADV